MEIQKARMPYVMFEMRAVEDRAASIEQGKFMTKDVEYALVTPMGSRDKMEFVYSEWIAQMRTEAENGRLPEEWLAAFERRYDAWKKQEELPVEGTALKTWPPISPAQIKNLATWNVFTVEQLAGANEELIRRMGMGGRALQQTATEWLKAAAGTGKIAMEVAGLKAKLEGLEAVNQQLLEQNKLLRQQMTMQPAGQSIPAGTSIQSSELFDDEPKSSPRKL
jgi:hypothetical protein